ncbi:MAG: DUF370 domain-containing protein [Firmicutes bacterium]|nr:DUF370 domain-containing protein [Bacillota bacterium]
MFLHLGGDHVITFSQVVAIFDYNLRFHSKLTRRFLEETEDKGELIDVSEGNPKSFVVTTKGTYLSQISASTLKKRGANDIAHLDNYLK